jgi:23S rRNA (adenine2030-N6)-methyltransferase
VLRALARKEKPYLFLDTHAGIGRYDLASREAQATGEAARGIARLLENTPNALADYVCLVRELGLYPGSPALAAAVLRPDDRAIACELHPTDYAILRNRVGRNPQLALHMRDGYEAIGAFLPPPERRGLTFIDPPYEQPDELERLFAAIRQAQTRFATGVLMAWYPIKHRAPIRALHDALRHAGIPDIVAFEFCLREPLDPTRLNGSGLIVVNPPFQMELAMSAILAALLSRLGEGEPGEGTAIVRLAQE